MANILLGHGDMDAKDSPSVELSESALAVMQSAARFQSKASDTRLTTKKPASGSGSNPKFLSSVHKARAVKAERKIKRDEFRNKDTTIRVAATLWSLNDNQKMTQVSFQLEL